MCRGTIVTSDDVQGGRHGITIVRSVLVVHYWALVLVWIGRRSSCTTLTCQLDSFARSAAAPTKIDYSCSEDPDANNVALSIIERLLLILYIRFNNNGRMIEVSSPPETCRPNARP